MDAVLAAFFLVLLGVIVLSAIAAVAGIVLAFLLLFWPTIAGVTLAIMLGDAGADGLAAICVFGGIGFNVLWWCRGFWRPELNAELPISTTDAREDRRQQMLRRAQHEYGGKPQFFFHAADGMSAVAVDAEAGKLLLWTDRTGLVYVVDGHQVLSARVEATCMQEHPDEQRIQRIDLQLIQRHPLYAPRICFFSAAGGETADQAQDAMREARAWEARISDLRVEPSPSLRLVATGNGA